MINCHIDNNTGGFSPIYGQTRNPFQIQFYLVGILFLVFDIELLITYPYSVNVYQIGAYSFWIFTFFFLYSNYRFCLRNWKRCSILHWPGPDQKRKITPPTVKLLSPSINKHPYCTAPFFFNQWYYLSFLDNAKQNNTTNSLKDHQTTSVLNHYYFYYEKDTGGTTTNVYIVTYRYLTIN